MRHLRPAAVLLACVTLGAGCGGPDRHAQPANEQASAATRQPERASALAPAVGTILVTAHDYAFGGVPPRVPAGWLTLRMVNLGRELHMLGIERMPAGMSASKGIDGLLKGLPSPPGDEDWGGPNAVSPGDTSTATLFFPPGQYVIACAVEGADGKPHFSRGMVAALEVDSAPAGPAPPAGEDARVTLTDYHVDVRGELRPGTRTVRVRDAATQGHDLEILQILPGHSAAEALAWFEHPARGTPAARAVGGVVEIHPGQEALVTATLRPGRYLFLCWVPDAAGLPHFRHGMWVPVTVPPAA